MVQGRSITSDISINQTGMVQLANAFPDDLQTSRSKWLVYPYLISTYGMGIGECRPRPYMPGLIAN